MIWQSIYLNSWNQAIFGTFVFKKKTETISKIKLIVPAFAIHYATDQSLVSVVNIENDATNTSNKITWVKPKKKKLSNNDETCTLLTRSKIWLFPAVITAVTHSYVLKKVWSCLISPLVDRWWMLKWTYSRRLRSHQVSSVIYAKQSYYVPIINLLTACFPTSDLLLLFLFRFAITRPHRWPASNLTFYMYVYLK